MRFLLGVVSGRVIADVANDKSRRRPVESGGGDLREGPPPQARDEPFLRLAPRERAERAGGRKLARGVLRCPRIRRSVHVTRDIVTPRDNHATEDRRLKTEETTNDDVT